MPDKFLCGQVWIPACAGMTACFFVKFTIKGRLKIFQTAFIEINKYCFVNIDREMSEMTKHTAPEFHKKAFNCPHCGAFAHMEWIEIKKYYGPFNSQSIPTAYKCALCSHCKQISLWKPSEDSALGEMLYPDFGATPLPSEDMPEDVKKDYEEAARIFIKSPRGAAALLRLGLQKLCIHLGEEGKNINADIRSLVKKEVLSGQVIKVADTLRIIGNNAVHPGQIVDEDFDKVAAKMFDLINAIVEETITKPKMWNNLYEQMPENARNAAEAQDKKALESKT
nr:DUF4145 domain-containing protein [uncultured Neisseria sp.]